MLKMKRKIKIRWCLNPIQVMCFWTFSPWKTLSGLFLPAVFYHIGIHLPCDIHIFKGESTAWMVIISFHFDNTEMAKPMSAIGPSSKDNTLCSPFCFSPTSKAHLQNLTQGNSQGISPCLPTSFSHFTETEANVAWSYFSFFSCLLNLILKHGPQENYDLG